MADVSVPAVAPIRRLFLWAPVVLHMAFLFALSSIRQPPLPSVEGFDKSVHVGLYAVLGALIARALASGSLRAVTMRVAVLSVVYTTLYGISDEVHQHFVPPRVAETWDVVADATGASIAAGVLCAWARRAAAPAKTTII